MNQIENANDVQKFLLRMMPHMLNGLNFEEAGRAVLADDERIYNAIKNNDEQSEFIKKELAAEVYQAVRVLPL